jgi:hypothetical protein
MLLLTKILSYLIFLRLSTIPTHPFGLPPLLDLDRCFGLLSCRLSNIYMITQFYRFMQETPQFDLHHGYIPGTPFMITFFCLSLISPCLPLFLICGCREHNYGIKTSLLPPSLPNCANHQQHPCCAFLSPRYSQMETSY